MNEIQKMQKVINEVLNKYKLVHGEVIANPAFSSHDGNIRIYDEDVSDFEREKEVRMLYLRQYDAYLAIDPSKIGKKRKTLIMHVPHHDIPFLIGKNGSNIKEIKKDISNIFLEENPDESPNTNINIIVKPLFVERDMIIHSEEERYIYKLEIDLFSVEEADILKDILTANSVSPLHTERYNKKGKTRTVLYFKGTAAAWDAFNILNQKMVLPDNVSPSFYKKVKEIYMDPEFIDSLDLDHESMV